jgi:hypothetical protein
VSFNPPDANRRDVSAYAPSSGVRDDPEPGNAKNATTLTTNEAKTIAYNLLFKVVNLNLKSFMVDLSLINLRFMEVQKRA